MWVRAASLESLPGLASWSWLVPLVWCQVRLLSPSGSRAMESPQVAQVWPSAAVRAWAARWLAVRKPQRGASMERIPAFTASVTGSPAPGMGVRSPSPAAADWFSGATSGAKLSKAPS